MNRNRVKKLVSAINIEVLLLQSSWKKEVENSQAVSSWDPKIKVPSGTCTQLCSNGGISKGKLEPFTAPKEFREQDEQIGMHEYQDILRYTVAESFPDVI